MIGVFSGESDGRSGKREKYENKLTDTLKSFVYKFIRNTNTHTHTQGKKNY